MFSFRGRLRRDQVRVGCRRRYRLQLLQRFWDGGGSVVRVLSPGSPGRYAGRSDLVEGRSSLR